MTMNSHKLLKLKGTDYSSHCRNCNFCEVGHTYNIVVRAKKHAIENNHSVEYYIENGRIFKLKQ